VSIVTEHTEAFGGLPVHWRRAPGPAVDTLYLHGVPNSARQWDPFLRLGGGLAVDLPGFGRSVKRSDFDYSIAGYDRFLESFLDGLDLGRVNLVMHDWGAVGLALAQRRPERVGRLVLIDTVPLLPGYRWHRIARAWRTPVLGELLMGVTTHRTLKLLSRDANSAPLPDDFLEEVMADLDHGTQRAILRLYRSAPETVLAEAGARLSALRVPSLVVWGENDPYIPAEFGATYAEVLGGAELVRIADAGHWPWLDQPELVGQIVEFMSLP